MVWGASTDIFHSSPPKSPHTHMIYYDIRNELSRANDRYCIQRPLREKSSINNKHIERTAKKCGKKMKKNRRKKFPALGKEIKYWCSRTWTRREPRKEKKNPWRCCRAWDFLRDEQKYILQLQLPVYVGERNHFTLENKDQVARSIGHERLITRKIDH